MQGNPHAGKKTNPEENEEELSEHCGIPGQRARLSFKHDSVFEYDMATALPGLLFACVLPLHGGAAQE